MKSFICLFVFFLSCKLGFAFETDPVLDSLAKELELASDYTAKAQILIKLGERKETHSKEQAIEIYHDLISLTKAHQDAPLAAKGHLLLGSLRRKLDDVENSTASFFSGLEAIEDSEGNSALRAQLNYQIGLNFHEKNDFDRAKQYYQASLAESASGSSFPDISDVYNNIGEIHMQTGSIDSALTYLEHSFKINRKSGNLIGQTANIENIGKLHLDQERHELAIKYFAEALATNRSRNEQSDVANNLFFIGIALYRTNRISAAIDSLDKSLQIATTLHLPNLQHQILNHMYMIHLDQENYKEALKFYTRYNNLEDSLVRKNEYTALVELEAKYKVIQNERTIQLSKSELLNQQLINGIILSVLVLALLVICMLTWFFLLKKKNEKILLTLNEEIDARNEKIQAINSNLEATVSQRTETIQVQNERLKEFAFMNSHKVRRPLSNLLGLLALMKDESDPKNRSELLQMVEESAKELDTIIYEINHQLREDESLV